MSNGGTDRLTGTLSLDDAVDRVRLVSPVRADALGKMGVRSVRDLLNLYPRRYIDLSAVETVLSATIGEHCTIVGSIYSMQLKKPKPKLSLVEITLTDGTGTLVVTAFRQPWLMDKLSKGMRIAVSGEVELNYGAKRMTNPFIEQLDATADAPGYQGRIIPVHPACEKISTAWMRTIMGEALHHALPVYDPLPLALRTKYRLMSRSQALQCIHAPQTMDEVKEAKRRLIYEELLALEVLLMSRAALRDAAMPSWQHVIDGPVMAGLRSSCPFDLTDDQRDAVDEILNLMGAQRRMNHLLLGDVGTGKTLVAAFALAAVADSGNQAVLMAPTEILAVQHAKTLERLFAGTGVAVGLLTGSTKTAERTELLAGVAEGSVQVLVGTHAVLEDDVRFNRCSLVIIDEQQRFGVDQRAVLLQRAPGADALFLTATPIPRTLALSLYGDLTLSYLKQRPNPGAGRTTTVLKWQDVGEAYSACLDALERGEQVYVVCPLVQAAEAAKTAKKDAKHADATLTFDQEDEAYAYAAISIESENDFPDVGPSSAIQRQEILANTVFKGYEVGLLHGKMSGAEKQQVMADFAAGRIQVLVATTVIEVGIDVPNATAMIIDSADMFGLSQLHQLRGRVGRGDKPGQVFLISSSGSKAALQRLGAMQRSDDGFELATYDLSLRREGDILGNRQHGASALKLVNVVRDAKVIEAAYADARAIVDADPNLTLPEHRAFGRELRVLFPDSSTTIGG